MHSVNYRGSRKFVCQKCQRIANVVSGPTPAQEPNPNPVNNASVEIVHQTLVFGLQEWSLVGATFPPVHVRASAPQRSLWRPTPAQATLYINILGSRISTSDRTRSKRIN